MKITRDLIISTCTLAGQLTSYYYGKHHSKDVIPYVMIGGFIGTILGEVLVAAAFNDK